MCSIRISACSPLFDDGGQKDVLFRYRYARWFLAVSSAALCEARPAGALADAAESMCRLKVLGFTVDTTAAVCKHTFVVHIVSPQAAQFHTAFFTNYSTSKDYWPCSLLDFGFYSDFLYLGI